MATFLDITMSGFGNRVSNVPEDQKNVPMAGFATETSKESMDIVKVRMNIIFLVFFHFFIKKYFLITNFR